MIEGVKGPERKYSFIKINQSWNAGTLSGSVTQSIIKKKKKKGDYLTTTFTRSHVTVELRRCDCKMIKQNVPEHCRSNTRRKSTSNKGRREREGEQRVMEEDKAKAENITKRFRGNSMTVSKSDGILQLTHLFLLLLTPSQIQTHKTLHSIQTDTINTHLNLCSLPLLTSTWKGERVCVCVCAGACMHVYVCI